MILSKDQFPVVVQAYDMTNGKEIFIAEQVVANQTEVDVFVNRYTGKLIKARALTGAENNSTTTTTRTHTSKSKSSATTIVVVVLILLIILLAIGFYTGWIQRTFGIDL